MLHIIRRSILFVVIVFAAPAFATTPDELHNHIAAFDVAEVEAALNAAGKQDRMTGTDPELQRDLFRVFWVTDPAVDAFTEKWLTVNPASANAMAARGWYLHAMGRANRGQDTNRYTFRGGYDLMQAQHAQAFSLFNSALKTYPNLLSASDGLLVLAQTVADETVIPVELERVMALAPNRGSLMRAMFALAPQWGGNFRQVQLLCARYAPMISTIADYSAETCAVDAVFYANFPPGDIRDAADRALAQMPHPVLDYARIRSAVAGAGPPELRFSVLESAKSTRNLTPDEAQAWVVARNAVKGLAPTGVDPAYTAAVAQGLDTLRVQADRDPFDTSKVLTYIDQLERNLWENGTAFDVAEATERVQSLLRAVPHSWRAWDRLAKLKADFDTGNPELVGPYYRNAIYYSNYGLIALQEAVKGTLPLIDIKSKRNATSGNLNLTLQDVANLDRTANCPVVAWARIATLICQQEGVGSDDCLRSGMTFLLTDLLQDTRTRNVCQTEANDPLETILFGPSPADF